MIALSCYILYMLNQDCSKLLEENMTVKNMPGILNTLRLLYKKKTTYVALDITFSATFIYIFKIFFP